MTKATTPAATPVPQKRNPDYGDRRKQAALAKHPPKQGVKEIDPAELTKLAKEAAVSESQFRLFVNMRLLGTVKAYERKRDSAPVGKAVAPIHAPTQRAQAKAALASEKVTPKQKAALLAQAEATKAEAIAKQVAAATKAASPADQEALAKAVAKAGK